MGISDHTLKWNMDIYIAVDKEIPGDQNTTMSGTFVSKFTKVHSVIPESDTKISLRVAKLRDIKQIKFLCGSLPAQNVQKNMVKTMLYFG